MEIACHLPLHTKAAQLRRSPATINLLMRPAQFLAVDRIFNIGSGQNDFTTAKTNAMEANAA